MDLHHRPLPTSAILLSTLLLISGCSSQPQQPLTAPPTHVTPPQQWQAPGPRSLGSPQPQGWLQQFHTPQLGELIEEALQHNHTIAHARVNLQRARQQTRLSQSALRPTSEGKLSAGRSRTHSSGSTLYNDSFGVELSTRWEADLWQRLSDQQQATLQLEAASAVDLRAAQLLLAAEVARGWFSAVESRQQVALSRERLSQYQQAASIIEQRYSSGITDALDLHLARSEVAIAEERLASQQLEQQRLLRRLETLLGRYPAAILETASTLPQLLEEIPAGIPATVLERRPDIESSYRTLEAAALETRIAAKNRLPRLALTAKGGVSSSELNHLLEWDSLLWSLLGNLTQPLFQQERLVAEERLQQLAQEQAATDYAATVLQAFQEVENHLAADHFYRLRAQALAQATEESREAAALALARYRGGLVDILTLLDAQQRAYDRESAHLKALASRIDNRIQLYLALGGDYQDS